MGFHFYSQYVAVHNVSHPVAASTGLARQRGVTPFSIFADYLKVLLCSVLSPQTSAVPALAVIVVASQLSNDYEELAQQGRMCAPTRCQ